jgi:diadenosine tetraphosphate (Ap4A) HIT family hydrolase
MTPKDEPHPLGISHSRDIAGQMGAYDRCPFCRPRANEILLERPLARALIDIRPLCRGHVLVVPARHVASISDADDETRAAVLELAGELAEGLRRGSTEAGIYEHGGSPICQPRTCFSGPTHAHVHVLPVAADLCATWMAQPQAALGVGSGSHYLYQHLSKERTAVTRSLPPFVPRHFLRTLIQPVLADRGICWLPMAAPPHLHAEMAADTRAMVSATAVGPKLRRRGVSHDRGAAFQVPASYFGEDRR